MNVAFYTDGACSGNPGIGGWGVVILQDNKTPIYLSGGSINTTNNKMELMATIKALEYFGESINAELFTDSKYVKDGIESWIIKWKKNGWKTSAKKPVKNKELWLKLDKLIQIHTINWQWIKGHIGNKYNEQADYLAREFIKKNNS